MSGAAGYNMLRNNQGVYFKAPNGAFKKINNLQDLDAYLYSQTQAPPAGTSVLPQ